MKNLFLLLFIWAISITPAAAQKPSNEQVYLLKQDAVKAFYDKFFSEDYYKTFPETVKENDPNYDPDLKLSIAELRKKYPLDWIEKKYGKIPNECCRNNKPGNPAICSNITCGFSSDEDMNEADPAYYLIKVASSKDFSESEIKSVFVNKVDLSKDGRPGNLTRIVMNDLYNSPLPENMKLKNFIFSPKIFFTALRNIDFHTVCTSSALIMNSSLPYYQDLVFMLVLQKNLPNQSKSHGRYSKQAVIISDRYNIQENKPYIEIRPSNKGNFFDCMNHSERMNIKKEFEKNFFK